jgi:uncharacterized membrane protein
MKIIDTFFEKSANKLICVFIFIYILIFGYICFLKYNSFHYYDWDFASDIIILWNSVHGKMLYYPFLEQNIFGAHLYLIALLIMPIYAIFQHPYTILFLQTIFLGLAAYPLYKLAKLKLNKTFALVISFAYLLYPSIGYINLFESHFEIYEIFFLFFALYYFERENFNKFLIFVLFAIICKENVSLSVFMLGIYALVRKRSKKWILVPSLLGIAWFFLAIKIIIPYFAKDASKLYQGGFIFSLYYRHLGSNIMDMIKTIIMHPIGVAQYALTYQKVLYIFHLFLPTGFLGVLNPAALLITLPIFMQNLLSGAPTHSAIQYQYVALLIPFIFFSVIHAFKKLLNYKVVYNNRIMLITGFLIIATISGFYLKAPQFYFVQYIKAYHIDDLVKEKNKLLSLIPKESSVIATFQFLPKLANRKDLYSMHLISTGFRMYTDVKYEPPANLEYALIDFDEPLMINSFFPPQAPDNVRSFLEDGDWRILKAVDDIVLFKKKLLSGDRLCEVVTDPKIKNVIDANINSQIIFLGYNIEKKSSNNDDTLHLVYYWKRKASLDNRAIGFFIQFLDSDNNVKLQKIRILGYRVYMLPSWPEGQIIKEHNYIFIPSDLEKGVYNVRAGLFYLDDGRILSVLDKAKTDNFGRIILGNIAID